MVRNCRGVMFVLISLPSSMLACFSYHKCSVHFEQLQKHWTVNQNSYLEIMARLCDVVCQARPILWPDAWCPTTVRLFMTHLLLDTKLTMTLENPLHSQALVPCGFWLFPELKTGSNSYRFSNTANIHRHVMDIPKKHPRREIPAMFWTVAISAHTVHCCARSLHNSARNFLCACA